MSIVLVGSTSGSVTLQEPVIAGTTVLDLPAVSGTILTTGSSGQSIPKAALPTGSVLQVVSSAYSTEATNSTFTWADTGLTATITPNFSTSKILVLVNEGCLAVDTNTTGVGLQLLRAGSNIATFGYYIAFSNGGAPNYNAYASLSYLDNPATTSATTYKVQFRSEQSNARARVQTGGTTATITLMEIAA
jgi:hypothetical protein